MRIGTARRTSSYLVFGVFLLLAAALMPAQAQRTVTPNEHASIFGLPAGGANGDWTVFGAYVGAPHYDYYNRMAADALKIRHGRFHQFCLNDESTHARFPYGRLKAYEASEVAAGRPPIFVTAYYQGKHRPVYFNWSLDLVNGRPTAETAEWRQAVNVTDDRFIRFWINYSRDWQNPALSNQWQGVDECAFMYSLYGVIDDAGNFIAGVRWDPPFPQNNDQFIRSIRTFFEKLRVMAPDIKVMCNMASLQDWSRFSYIYTVTHGVMLEDIHPRIQLTNRLKLYNMYTSVLWMAEQNRVGVLRVSIVQNNQADLRTALVAYTLIKGFNFFLAPRYVGIISEIPQSVYASLKADLGEPVQPCQSVRQANTPNDGYRLYSRETNRGILYLNMTGGTRVITLDPTRHFTDRNGTPVTTLSIPDGQGDYVKFAP